MGVVTDSDFWIEVDNTLSSSVDGGSISGAPTQVRLRSARVPHRAHHAVLRGAQADLQGAPQARPRAGEQEGA